MHVESTKVRPLSGGFDSGPLEKSPRSNGRKSVVGSALDPIGPEAPSSSPACPPDFKIDFADFWPQASINQVASYLFLYETGMEL